MKKQQSTVNKLCLSCRRTCRQPAAAVIASCPRYYAGPKIKRCTWQQLDLPLDTLRPAKTTQP